MSTVHEYDRVDFPLTVNADLSINTRNPAYSMARFYKEAKNSPNSMQIFDGSQSIPPVDSDAEYATIEDIVCNQNEPIYATIGEPIEEVKQNTVQATVGKSHEENTVETEPQEENVQSIQATVDESQEKNAVNTEEPHEETDVLQISPKEPREENTVQASTEILHKETGPIQATIEEPREDDTTLPSALKECLNQKGTLQDTAEELQHEEVEQNDATLDDVHLDANLSAAIEWLDEQWETLGPITDPQHPPARKTRLPSV